MYGYGAANGPGIGGYGFFTVAPNPYTYGYGFGTYPGSIGPMGLTHSGPGTPVGYGIAGVPGVGIPLWGFNPAASVGINPALNAAASYGPAWAYRPYGLSHLGPEGFGIGNSLPSLGGYSAGWPTTYPGLPLTPAWSSTQG
jgi:hypothetical protein